MLAVTVTAAALLPVVPSLMIVNPAYIVSNFELSFHKPHTLVYHPLKHEVLPIMFRSYDFAHFDRHGGKGGNGL